MAAAKLEVIISQLLKDIETKFQRLYPEIFGSGFSIKLLRTMLDVTGTSGRQKSNMSVDKPEVLVSQLLHDIETNSQLLVDLFS